MRRRCNERHRAASVKKDRVKTGAAGHTAPDAGRRSSAETTTRVAGQQTSAVYTSLASAHPFSFMLNTGRLFVRQTAFVEAVSPWPIFRQSPNRATPPSPSLLSSHV